MSLRLHPKFGVNPTIPDCFYCRKPKNEVLLLGAAYRKEAPSGGMVVGLEPCDECKEKYKNFSLLIEANDNPGQNPTPTGNFAAVKFDAFSKIFDVPPRKIFFIEPVAFKKVEAMAKEIG